MVIPIFQPESPPALKRRLPDAFPTSLTGKGVLGVNPEYHNPEYHIPLRRSDVLRGLDVEIHRLHGIRFRPEYRNDHHSCHHSSVHDVTTTGYH